MTRSNKLIAIVLCAMLLFATVALVAACRNDETGFRVTTDYDGSMGDVSVTPPREGELYADGEIVSVTVSPRVDVVVRFVKANGKELSLSDGVYSFAVTADTVVKVGFAYVDDATDYFTVSASVTPAEGAEVDISPQRDDGKYPENTFVSFAVNLQPHYVLESVTLNGEPITLVNGNRYTALVEQNISFEVTVRKVYRVTLVGGEGATVTFDQSGDDNLFAPDTHLTMRVQVDPRYELLAVKVGGAEVELVQGAYSFDLTDDVTVEVLTDRPLSQDLFDALTGSVVLSGDMTETEVNMNESNVTQISVTFDSLKRAVWQSRYFNGETVLDRVLTEEDDYAVYVTRNLQGKAVRSRPLDETGAEVDEPFARRFNPFDKLLSVDDFSYIGNGVWTLADMSKASDAAYALTGEQEEIAVFELIAEEDSLTGVHIVTEVKHVTQQIWDITVAELDVRNDYAFTLSQSNAEVPADRFSDYEFTQAHADLQQALTLAAAATSYKAEVTVAEQGETTRYTVYFADGVIWFEGEQGESYGYFQRADGKLWRFTAQGGNFALSAQPVADCDMRAFAPRFLPQEASLCLFEDKGNGEFALRVHEAEQLLEDGSGENTLGGLFAEPFALGENQREYFPLAELFSVTLQSNGALKAEVSYATYELRYTLVFGDWNATSLPSSVTGIADSVQGAFDPSYVGMWIEEGTPNRIDITLDEVRINNRAATLSGGDAQNGYEATDYLHETYLFVRQGDLLSVTCNGEQHLYRPQLCAWEMFVGEYFAIDGKGNRCTLSVTVEGLSWNLNGQEQSPLLFDFQYYDNENLTGYAFTVSLFDPKEPDNLVSLFLVQSSDSFELLHFYSDALNIDLLFRTEDYVPDLSDFVGEYSCEGYSVEITAHGLTLYAAGRALQGEYVDISRYVNENNVNFLEISFWAEQEKYYLQCYTVFNLGWLELYIDSGGDDEFLGTVRLANYRLSWDMYYGTFMGYATDGTLYKAVFDETGITFTVGGETFTVLPTDFTFDYNVRRNELTFLFSAGGKNYELRQADNAYARLTLQCGNVTAALKREGYVYDLSYFAGVYESDDEDGSVLSDSYRIEITDNSISVTVNGVTANVEILDVNESSYGKQIVLLINGKACTLVDFYGSLGDRGVLYLLDEGNLNVAMQRV